MDRKKAKRNRLLTVLLVFVFLAGLSLLLYPTAADYWNSIYQSRAIADYNDYLVTMDNAEYDRVLAEARQYNEDLKNRTDQYGLPDDMAARYEAALDVTGTGVMGYVEIPEIKVTLPIYHGTTDSVLQRALGHLEWSDLPVGGESTHCVISGHRGMPSSRLLTDLDQLVVGDVFMLHILDETYTYEVDQILIVEPQDVTALAVVPGEDYCTLMTCTPYGINTHRLLVRGHRIAADDHSSESYYRVQANARQIQPSTVAPLLAAPILLLLFIAAMLFGNRRKR